MINIRRKKNISFSCFDIQQFLLFTRTENHVTTAIVGVEEVIVMSMALIRACRKKCNL